MAVRSPKPLCSIDQDGAIQDVFPAIATNVVNLPREELAAFLLHYLWRYEMESDKPFTKANLICEEYLTAYVSEEVGKGGLIEMSRRLSEGWSWLESQIYVAEEPNYGMGGSGIGYFITDAGRKFAQRDPGTTYIRAERLLPVGSLTRLAANALRLADTLNC